MVHNYCIPDGSKWDDGDIVISGISARLPNCDSVEEFQEKLLAKVDLITDEPRRFQNGLYGAIMRYGLLKDLSKFDAKFFNIHPKQAERMDPQIRNLLEVTYEATVDAGLHPEDLKGTKTGVVVGVACSETQDKWSQMPGQINGYEYTGCTRTMFANRVSYFFDIKGPSYSIDTASSTTLIALQQGYDMIRDGLCDACFVCGTDLVLNPCICLMFQCLNMLSPEGKCKAFDIGGDGYVRSEGVVAVLLQKASDAKRIYANVLAAGSNCDGYKDEGITFPSGAMQVKLFRKVAAIANIDPSTLDFMEAHGSATRVGDPQEMNAVTEVFTTGRKQPLRTGSIKSNMGHGEPASALSAVIKVCVAMECGIIPPNLHYNIPNPDIPALLDGRLKVITEPTPWDGGLVAVNSFGVGGANGHALLLSNKKRKNIIEDPIARLICVSGVTENAVHIMLHKIESLPRDAELYALLNNIHRKNIKGHKYRGYMIVEKSTIKIVQPVEKCEDSNLCVVFPGLESGWMSIKPDLMKLQIFQESIEACDQELKNFTKTINLTTTLTTLGKEKSPLTLVVAVIALQIAFINVLRSLDLLRGCVMGHNIGEIAAAYADNVCSLQQAISVAYHVGSALQRFYYSSAVLKTNVPARECNPPADVSICGKITSSCTLFSGPKQSISKFAEKIKAKGVRVEEVENFVVDVVGILRSSNYVSKLKSELEKVLHKTNQASELWSCTPNTSVTDHLITSLTCSAQNVKRGKPNTVTLRIGCDLNKNTLPKHDAVTLSLISRQATAIGFLSTIGELFTLGFQPQLQNLYPEIEFPVSHRTPMIQSMIEWDHSSKWNVVSFAPKDGRVAGELDIVVDFTKKEFESLLGNRFCGNDVIPKAFYLYAVWKALSRFQNKSMTSFPLIIENISFLRDTVVPGDESVKFSINVLETTGKFELWESENIVVSGNVRIPQEVSKEQIPNSLLNYESSTLDFEMNKDTVYRCMKIKQYHYNDTYKRIQAFNFKSKCGRVKTNNWSSLIETFLQITVLLSSLSENSTSVVSFIRKVVLDARKSQKDDITVVQYNHKWNVLKSDILEIQGIKLKSNPLVGLRKPRIEHSTFVPFDSSHMENAAEATLMLALENWIGCNDLKVAELINDSTESLLSFQFKNANPSLNIDLTVYSSDLSCANKINQNENIKYSTKDISIEPVETNCHIVIARNILNNNVALENMINSVRKGGCILLEENLDEQFIGTEHVACISRLSSDNKSYILLQKLQSKIRNSPRIITVINVLQCVQKLKNMQDGEVLIIAKASDSSGIIQFIRCLMVQSKSRRLSVMLLEDKNAPTFSLTNSCYVKQLKKNFPINVYKDGTWGTYVSVTYRENLQSSVTDAFVGLRYEMDKINFEHVQANSDIYKTPNDPWKIHCTICCASINMRDLEIFNGKSATAFSLPSVDYQRHQLGMEFSGFEGKEKVFGLLPGGALATSVLVDKELVWPIPDSWSFEEASTVPYSYALGYCGLIVKGNLQNCSSILIIGAQETAIAAIYIALSLNCTVFVLLNDKQQKHHLRKLFPQISNTNIIVCNNDNFYLDVLQKTGGKGVEFLFNTVSVEKYKFQSYICSLAEKGVCIYFNRERSNEEVLGSAGNMRCITFHRISPTCLFENENLTLRKNVNELMIIGIKKGVIQPLPYTTFNNKDIKEAFKSMSDEQNICKTVINIRSPEKCSFSALKFPVQGRTYFDTKKSYIVSIDYSQFGAYVTSWMMGQGARNLVLICDKDANESENILRINIENMKLECCRIMKITLDEINQRNCESVIQTASQFGPVGGVFYFTHLQVQNLENLNALNENAFKSVLDGKVNLLVNMDVATQKLSSNLDHFVAFSSIELEYGIPKYSLYSYANSVMQNLMRNRRNKGLSGTLLQWGQIGESTSDVFYNHYNTESCLSPQSITSCLQTLHTLLHTAEPIVSVFIALKPRCVNSKSKVKVVTEGVAKFLGIKDPTAILPTLTMLELGLDSLIGTDIQQFLDVNYGVTMSTQEIRELTFEKLRILAVNL